MAGPVAVLPVSAGVPAGVPAGVGAFDLDALAVSDRLRLFNFTRRDDYVAYLWVLRGLDRLRGMHVAQAHTDDVAAVLAEFAAAHADAPASVGNLRDRLDNLFDDGVVHRLEDASRAGSLARYRNRQSVYQFSELGHRAYTAVESVLAARVQDANLSRLVFSDILRDLVELAEANRGGDGEEIVRRLASLDRAVEDMAGRAARFHLTLGDITRSTDTSPENFLRYKHALMAHMSDFMAELDRYLPRLGQAVADVEATGIGALLDRAAGADDRPLMGPGEVLADWRRRWAGVRAWFVAGTQAASRGSTGRRGGGADEVSRAEVSRADVSRGQVSRGDVFPAGFPADVSRAAELGIATRAAVSVVIALLRQITESQRRGVNRSTALRHLAGWVFDAADEDAAHALMSAAFNLRSARHLGGVHADGDLISPRASWQDAPGVDVAVTLFRRGKAPTTGQPQRLHASAGMRAQLRSRQTEQRAAERDAARGLLADGAAGRVLTEAQTRVLLRLLTRALEARTVVAGRIADGTGGNDVLVLRLVPAEAGSAVRTPHGILLLPGLRLELAAARG